MKEEDVLSHYGVPGMRWGRHMRREALAGRANRAHFEKEMLKDNLKKRTDPFERRAVDYEHAAKRTGKKKYQSRAEHVRAEIKYMSARRQRYIDLFDKKEARRDAAVKKIDKTISEMGELKIKSPEFDRWLERH